MTHFREMAMTKAKPEKKQILEEIDTAIMRYLSPLKQRSKIEIGDFPLNFLSADAGDILVDHYMNTEKLQDRAIKQIKQYRFDEIKDVFGEEIIPLPLSLNFFWRQ